MKTMKSKDQLIESIIYQVGLNLQNNDDLFQPVQCDVIPGSVKIAVLTSKNDRFVIRMFITNDDCMKTVRTAQNITELSQQLAHILDPISVSGLLTQAIGIHQNIIGNLTLAIVSTHAL